MTGAIRIMVDIKQCISEIYSVCIITRIYADIYPDDGHRTSARNIRI
jgi:hypothetical protein